MFRFLTFLIIGVAVFVGPQMMQKGKLSERVQQLLKTGEFSEGSPEESESSFVDLQTTSWGSVTDPRQTANGADTLPPELAGAVPSGPIQRELMPLSQCLRFDVTPEWVTHHFERVTVLPTTGGEGMRVPLISGTRVQDLAGSLTYYFDRDQVVQRIALDAETGDPREVTAFVNKHFKLKELASGVFVNQYNGVVISGMFIQRSRLIQRSNPQGSHRVRLELNRPGNYKQVSRVFHQQLMQASR